MIKKINEEDPLPYTIGAFEGLNTKIYINPEWGNFFRDQYFLLLGWIQFHKCVYIQSKNSGVPNIIAKVSWKNNGIRKLKLVRDLWVEISKTSAEQICSIYTGEPINFKNFDLDHFIPWSYIGNDELWNLVPTEPNINSSKSNHLPSWDVYIKRFVDIQWFLYCCVFSNEKIRFKLDRCRQDNLNEIWATELLFVPGRTKEELKNILVQNIRPIYNSAELQGFTIWTYK